MDALELLKYDHDVVRELFGAFRSAAENEDTGTMEELAVQIFHELDVHTAIEERVFYPAVREVGGGELDDLTDESKEEHHVVDTLIEEARALSASDDRFKAKMTVMIENVEHHASEEEDEMFPQVRDLMSSEQLEVLGARLVDEKRRIEAQSMSKRELYEAARDQEIEGRSTMTKDELAEAVIEDEPLR